MTDYLDRIQDIADNDVRILREKDADYGGSWKRRGGIGAYMMAVRKADRLEVLVQKHGYDIFAAAAADAREEGVLDDIRDLRRYLLLIEAEILKQQQQGPAAERCVPRNRPGEDQPRGYDPEQDLAPKPHVYKAVEQATILADRQLKTLKEVAEKKHKERTEDIEYINGRPVSKAEAAIIRSR